MILSIPKCWCNAWTCVGLKFEVKSGPLIWGNFSTQYHTRLLSEGPISHLQEARARVSKKLQSYNPTIAQNIWGSAPYLD